MNCEWMRKMSMVAMGLGLMLVAFYPGQAEASPWTLPEDELVLDLSHDFQVASNEYLPDGEYQRFPLDSTFRSHTARFGLRYGFSDRFEGAATFNIALVTYRSDPLILADFSDGATAGEATAEIRDFTSTRFGAGDVYLHGRYALKGSGLVRIASESTVKLPTGYEAPQGTFQTNADGETEIVGQATLGDGQSDITQSVLFGAYIPPTRSFVRLDAGFKYRFGSPGHQIVGAFRAGQFLGESFLLTVGLGGHYTVTEGDVIGEAFAAIDPSVPATEFTPDNIQVFDLRLDSDALRADVSALIQLGDFEFIAGYARTLWGRNTAAVNSFSLSALFVFPDFSE